MVRFLINAAVYMVAAAIGLLVADMLLDGLSVTYPTGFLTASLLFGVIQAVLTPFFEKVTRENASMLTGGVGLFSALVALFVTATISDEVTVTGLMTWVWAALVIWLASMLAGLLLKVTVVKRVVKDVRD